MATVPLPEEPNLGQLKKQAKDLRAAYAAGDPGSRALVAEHAVRGRSAAPAAGSLPLSTAQLVIARHYGFASWPGLKRHVELVESYTRAPDRIEMTTHPADEFLRLACLNYGDDGPERWEAARRVLAAHPGLAESSIHVAAAVADVEVTGRLLDADPTLACREGGPFRWEPLFCLAYARHDPDIDQAAVLATARLLLDAGADPDAGYLWHGLPSPFTVLTGVFGEGELGPVLQPRHPVCAVLARLLLERGADPNDGQTLYNRMFGRDDDHLELLFEFGLGTGDGGPWRARLGAAIESPAGMVRDQLRWAITHDLQHRVELLADRGVDLRSPFADGRSPCDLAALNGNRAIEELLIGRGASLPDLAPPDAFVAAAMRADRGALERLCTGDPRLLDDVRRRHPGLIVWAAAQGRTDAVASLAELGFDVNALGRGDAPIEQPWETALHQAVSVGNLELARLLISLGADASIRDMRFDSTPLGWAHYFDQPALVALLEQLGADETST